jgi:hypothetical protein
LVERFCWSCGFERRRIVGLESTPEKKFFSRNALRDVFWRAKKEEYKERE